MKRKGASPQELGGNKLQMSHPSEEDNCSWNSSSKEEEDEFLSSDRVNPIKTGRRMQFISDSDTE